MTAHCSTSIEAPGKSLPMEGRAIEISLAVTHTNAVTMHSPSNDHQRRLDRSVPLTEGAVTHRTLDHGKVRLQRICQGQSLGSLSQSPLAVVVTLGHLAR